jgi:signal transduction histidine kinase
VTQTARTVARESARSAPPRGPAGAAARAAARWAGQATAGTAAWYGALTVNRRQAVQDTTLALSLAAASLLSLLPYLSQLHPSWLALVLVSGQCLPLAWRRAWPVPALICSGLLRDLYDARGFGFAPLPLAPAIAFATVADRSGPVLRWITLVATAGGIAYSQALPGHNQPYDAIVQASIFGVAWTVGTLSRVRRESMAAVARRAEMAEAELDQAASRAAAAERSRIARELHDVVAHHVSLMAVQAEAVGALLPARPAEAAKSAESIAATARQAMTELRRLLGVLRFNSADQEHSPERTRLTPAPSVSRLDELFALVRDSGLPVSCTVSGSREALPPGVDLTAYRIVQEALTNALRHAPGSAAAVTVGCEGGFLSVEVTNTAPRPSASRDPMTPDPANGQGTPATPATSPMSRELTARSIPQLAGGYGLAGIAERVASCGGSLALGPAPDGGFTVTARLPLT